MFYIIGTVSQTEGPDTQYIPGRRGVENYIISK